jgi:hypothetical protein
VKDDVEIPPAPPRKRRELERALPVWLATWASDESLPPSQRRRAQEERDRRKALVADVRVGVILGEEGMTPAQREVVLETLAAVAATELHYDGLRSPHMRRLLLPLDDLNVTSIPQPGDQELVKASTMVIAAPKEPEKPDRVEGVWEAVRYAKHRKVPVRVVLPNGDER